MDFQIRWNFFFLFIFFWSCSGEVLEEGCVDRSKITDSDDNSTKVIVVSGKGTLYSPGFKENKDYPKNVACTYHLQADSRSRHIRLHFNSLDIDATDGCEADSLSIYDFGSSGTGTIVARHCGDQIPFDYVSENNEMQLEFITDEFGGGRGFNITYSVQSTGNVCRLDQKQCRNRNCVDYSDICDGFDDCGDGTDEEKCFGNIIPSSECGKPEIEPASFADFDRIVGGTNAVYGSWPWMAELQTKLVEPCGHVCGGALINAQWVLTAAHCFEEMRTASECRIHLGNHHKFKKDPYEQIRYVERIVIHGKSSQQFEQDGEFDIVNDMALIKLNAPVEFSKYVKPICLPDPNIQLNITSNCYATGWGMTRGTGGSDLLKQAYHPIHQDVMCTRLVGSEMFVKETMICAGSMSPMNGACHGDSGGPLACEIKHGRWSIVGVASYITDTNFEEGLCGLKATPTVFNRVSVKNDWIRTMVNRYS